MVTEADQPLAIETRRRLLTDAAMGDLVHAYHMPFPGLARIKKDGSKFAWERIRD